MFTLAAKMEIFPIQIFGYIKTKKIDNIPENQGQSKL